MFVIFISFIFYLVINLNVLVLTNNVWKRELEIINFVWFLFTSTYKSLKGVAHRTRSAVPHDAASKTTRGIAQSILINDLKCVVTVVSWYIQ